MKNYFRKLLLPLALICIYSTITSCKKYLDKSPLADIDEKEAFQSFRNFQGFTEELYNCIPLITAVGSHNNWNFGDDEMWEPTETRLLAYNIDHGDYWGWNSSIFGSWFKAGGNPASNVRGDKGNLWGLSWYAIRKANIGLANLDLLVEASEEEKKLIEGQLYFFRGWYHFMLMQYWGGLPYIDKALPPAETPKVQRLNYQETAEKVALDLSRAAELLPVNWDVIPAGIQTKGNNDRRINKIMALAFLGKNLLLAGSPLMNEESTGSPTYNVELCKRAAEVLGEALQLTETTNRYQLIPFEYYSEIFWNNSGNGRIPGSYTVSEPGAPDRTYKEAIFLESMAEVNGRFRWNQATDYRPTSVISNGIKVYPTANYVDNYGMANGLPINMQNPAVADAESGYDPQYPWKGRDPRFYHDIMIDGEKAVTNPSLAENNQFIQYASLFTGGHFRTIRPDKACFTGYMLSKYNPKLANQWESQSIDNNLMVLSLLRLADVYLLYAEAASEGYNSPMAKSSNYSKTAVEAVDFIRDRPGLNVGHVAAKFLTSQEAFRSEYRRERAVELAFEGHRFVDLRRWLLFTERPYTYKKGIDFDRGMPHEQVYADPKNARVLNFRQRILFERKYEKRHYWFPFIVSDVNIYEGFQQNPGW